MMNSLVIPPNVGSNLVGMLIGTALDSVEAMRNRISNVVDAPLKLVEERGCECITFDLDGASYFGELRGRNRDYCINPSDANALSNRAIALRVLLDGDAVRMHATEDGLVPFLGRTALSIVEDMQIYPYGPNSGRYLGVVQLQGQSYGLRIAASKVRASCAWVGYEFVDPIGPQFDVLPSTIEEVRAHLAGQVAANAVITGEKPEGLSLEYRLGLNTFPALGNASVADHA